MADKKDVKARVRHKYDTSQNWGKASFTPLEGELIIYADPGKKPKLKFGDGVTKISDLPFTSDSDELKLVDYPTIYEALSYNGYPQAPTWRYSAEAVIIKDEIPQTNVGTYITRFQLLPGYAWKNTGSTQEHEIGWSIQKSLSFTLDTTSVTFTPTETVRRIAINSPNYEELSLSVSVSDTSSISAKLSADKKYVELTKLTSNQIKGVLVTLSSSESANMNASSRVITVNVDSSNLDDFSWDQIKKLAKNKQIENYFEVGDCKQVDLSMLSSSWGISNTDLSNIYVYIIGINHNKSYETPNVVEDTIHFAGFKRRVNNTWYDLVLSNNVSSNYYKHNGTNWVITSVHDAEWYNYNEKECITFEGVKK